MPLSQFDLGLANSETLITKPSVPEFAVELISSPPESQSVNRTIELSIKNQPFVSSYGFFYNIRMRINDGNWSLLYTIDDVPTQSNGEYTILLYPSGQPVVEYQYTLGDRIQNLFAGDRVDFQVQAMIGYIHRVWNPNYTSQLDMYPYVFTGETSDWSNTQTITIPLLSTPSSSPLPSREPQQTEPFPTALVIAIVILVAIATIALVVVILAKLLVYYRKNKQKTTENNQ